MSTQPTASATPTALVLGRAERTPRAVALRVYESGVWVEYGWDDVARTVARVAGLAASAGVEPGSVVALACGSRVEWSLSVWAMTGLGATVVAVPAHATTEALADVARLDPALWILEGAQPFDGITALGVTGTRLVVDAANLPAATRQNVLEWDRDVVDGAGSDDAAVLTALGGLVAALDPTTVALRLPGENGRELTHADLVTAGDAGDRPSLADGDEYLSFLPPTWATEARLLAGDHPTSGAVVSFGSRGGGGLSEVATVQPTVLVAPAEWWTDLAALVTRSAAEPAPLAKGPLRKVLAGGGDGLAVRLTRRALIRRFGLTRVRSAHTLGGLSDQASQVIAGLGVPLGSPLERPVPLGSTSDSEEPSGYLEEAR